MTTEFLNKAIARTLIAAVLTTYCGISELAHAQTPQTPQQATPATTDTQAAPGATTDPQPEPGPSALPAPSSDAQSQTAPSYQTQTQPAAATDNPAGAQQNSPSPGMVNPSEGPLTPVPPSQQQPLPNAPSTAQQPPATVPSQQNGTLQQPVGAAGAQVGPTAGGAASKPAGNAIAPTKQRQMRSFLIKLGAIAAAGAAIGTVVGLSRGTSSKPPGTR